MKCAVVVVLCVGLAASAKTKIGTVVRSPRQYDASYHDGLQGSYLDDGSYDFSFDKSKYLEGNDDFYSHDESNRRIFKKLHSFEANNQIQYSDGGSQQHVHPSYFSQASYEGGYQGDPYQHYQSLNIPVPTYQTPTYGSPTHYAPPLAPYPPQYNQFQTDHQKFGEQVLTYPQGNFAIRPNYGGYTDLFDGFGAPAGPKPTTTTIKTTPTTVRTRKPSTVTTRQQSNNILSQLLALSQSSSSLSQPQTTKQPAAVIVAPTQPAPKVQVYAFGDYPPPLQNQQVLYSNRPTYQGFY